VRLAERIHRIGGALAGYRAVRERDPLLPSVLAARAAVVAATASVIGHRPPGSGREPDRPAHETAGP
jgi:hypothetical protein